MSNKKITDLPELTNPTTDDVFPIVDIATNTTQKVQVGNLPVQTAVTTALATKQATLVSGTNIKTINGVSVVGSGDVVTPFTPPSGVAGAIQFSAGSAFASDATNLFWDDTNNRLGVGTNAPNTTLEVKTANTGDVDFVNFTNGDGTNTARFKANGAFILGSSSDFNLLPGTATLTRFGASFGFLSAPSAQVHIKGSGSTSATTSLLVQNSSGTELFRLKDDKNIDWTGIIGAANGSRYIQIDDANLGNSYLAFGGHRFFAFDGSGYNPCLTITGNGVCQIAVNSATPNASAVFDINSTTRGFLPPRMTTTQKNAIATPAAGLVVYDSTTNKLCCYNGSTWNDLF